LAIYLRLLCRRGARRRLSPLAEKKLEAFTDLVLPAHDHEVAFGFNEWIRAQDGTAQGNDWQTWSAAMYLYAATCVEQKRIFSSLSYDRRRENTLHCYDPKRHASISLDRCYLYLSNN